MKEMKHGDVRIVVHQSSADYRYMKDYAKDKGIFATTLYTSLLRYAVGRLRSGDIKLEEIL